MTFRVRESKSRIDEEVAAAAALSSKPAILHAVMLCRGSL